LMRLQFPAPPVKAEPTSDDYSGQNEGNHVAHLKFEITELNYY
jgi:hypothetical protein